jgi:phosphomannomutase
MIFDIDGTIAESGKPISAHVYYLLKTLKEKTGSELAICGGGTFEKATNQIGDLSLFDHIFSECGCVYYKRSDDGLYCLCEKNIRTHPLFDQINVLIKHSMKFIANLDYNLGGHMIDIRKGLVYVSMIGMTALESEREDFLRRDSTYHYREKLVTELKALAKTMGCEYKIQILIGGAVGVSIMPAEYDKSQILEYLGTYYSKIAYFGDKYMEGGNDYTIMNAPGVIPYRVNSVEQTISILELLFESCV